MELFFTLKLCTYAKLNCLKWNCFLILKLRIFAKLNCLK